MFQSISIRKPKKNKFDLSHDVKLSCNMGSLIPVLLEEIVPGDSFKVRSEIMMRLAPMIAPMMHKVDVYVHYFFVPNRIIWEDWESFITGGEDGTEAPVHPSYSTFNLNSWGFISKGHLSDYLGIPPLTASPTHTVSLSALPFRAYTTIYNEFYRDQNLTDPAIVPLTSGPQTDIATVLECLVLRQRAWEKDYFTSALPWAQRGNPVNIPATIEYSPISTITSGGNTGNLFAQTSGRLDTLNPPAGASTAQVQNLEEIGIDINDLRRSNALQKWMELAARGGARYIEQMLSFFGVVSSDSRLQRPEYLGGGKQPIMISEVLQTGETATTPQGTMAGHGISVGASNEFTKTFEEHGHVLGIMSVLPRTAYQNGIHRKWRRFDKFDYYFPQFAHLGEQEIQNGELFYDDGPTDPFETWGYQARFAEYKHASSRVAGDFRDDLSFYHMGRIFDSLPALNTSFINSNPTTRIFADTSGVDKLWVQIQHNISALRPMPYFSEPKLIP